VSPTVADAGTEEIPAVVRDSILGWMGLVAGGANVIMQLSRLPVGRGVAESRVESGRADRHPIKRTRTTFSYLAIAVLGTSTERAAMRREVDRAHRLVHSEASDPVAYNAFDPDLQLWVAACLYRGVELSYALLRGEPDEDTADLLYRHSARLATTLQVPEGQWPPDREAFEEYWKLSLDRVQFDDVTRAYLLGLANLHLLPLPLRLVFGPMHLFLTTGFLPEPFRSELGLDWGPGRQVAFDTVTRTAGRLSGFLPRPVREFPINAYLWDARRRIAAGRPIV
jgi:uncharacterized protein (DUF2236 family)